MIPPQIRYTRTADGTGIAWAIAGTGPPVLIVPFVASSHVERVWHFSDNLPRLLAESFSVVWYDARGTGMSHCTAPDFSIEAMLRDADAVVAAAELREFAVVSVWDGVPIALAYAARHPAAVKQLVLVDGWSTPADYLTLPTVEAGDALRQQDWVLYTDTASRVLAGLDDDRYAREWADYWRASVDRETHWMAQDAKAGWDVSEVLPTIAAPVLLIHYRNNAFFPVAAAERMTAALPNARLFLNDGYRPSSVVDIVRGFLGGRPRSLPTAGAFRAVLFSDLVGHSAMMAHLGDERMRVLLREHEHIARVTVAAHGGTEVKTLGDGFMVSFASVARALECAVALQQAFDERNRQASTDERLDVRIGVNAGEPIEDEGDLFGTAVILAARVVAQAGAGEILATNAVRELCVGKGFVFADRGEFVAKGLHDPVRLFSVAWRA